jgi:GNAT superfamily N-acetyltransferase
MEPDAFADSEVAGRLGHEHSLETRAVCRFSVRAGVDAAQKKCFAIPRGGGSVKLYYYAAHEPDLIALQQFGERIAADHGAVAGSRVVWFSERPGQARGRIMVKRFSADDDRASRDGVHDLAGCPVPDTFGAFADEVGPEGFSFLYQRLKAGHQDGPILVTVADDRIVGGLGPLSTVAGPDGRTIQQPAYFAVHPDYRGRGYGRTLWRASMAWGRTHGADVKILQAAPGSAAEALYVSEGLETYGYVCTGGQEERVSV